MTALWKNIQGIRRVILETLFVFIFTLLAYLIAYCISGKTEIAIIIAAFVVAGIYVAVFATAVAAAAAEKYKAKYWKVLIIYILGALVLFGAVRFAVPYLAIGILAALCLGVDFLFSESELRLWLAVNKPPAPVVWETRERAGCGAYRAAWVVVGRHPLPEPLRLRLHRRLYNLYIN